MNPSSLTEKNQLLALMHTHPNNTDSHTGLRNKQGFEQQLQQWCKILLPQGIPISAILFNIDHFRNVNQDFWHELGNQCLKRIADSAHHCLKAETARISRCGGEDFTIMLAGKDQHEARIIGDQVRQYIEQQLTHRLPGAESIVTISCGIATFTEAQDGKSQDLFRNAYQALILAEGEEGNCCIVAY